MTKQESPDEQALRVWHEMQKSGLHRPEEFARRLRAELARGQEPVLRRYDFTNLDGKIEKVYEWLVPPDSLPAGTLLYAAPVAKPAAQDCVKLQSGRDGVWAHFHAGDQHFSYCLDNDWMAKKFCNAYRDMLAAASKGGGR